MALIATLITHRSNPILDTFLIKKIMTAVNSSRFYWLSNSIACDIILPSNCTIDYYRDTILAIINDKPIDIIIHESKNRRKSLLIADMDSTMIQQECIDELANTIGIKEQVSHITDLAMNGEIPFQESLRERVSLLKGISKNIIHSIINERITYNPGGYELVNTMKKNGAFTILVTGGFTVFASIISKHLGFDQYYANRLIEKNEQFTGQIAEPILDCVTKSNILLKNAKMLNINPDDIIAVGDGSNDIDMIKIAGYGVSFHAKSIVEKQANIRINHADLESLLYIQGYKQNEFVRAT